MKKKCQGIKNSLLAVFATVSLTIAMSSCVSNPYYQICSVQSDLLKNESGEYAYSDNAITISYNFWSENGKISFLVSNNSDDIVYLDLANSFFIKNGIAFDYFLNSSSTSSSGVASSYAAAATNSYSASATAYGIWKTPSLYDYEGSVSASVGKSLTSAATTAVQKTKSITFNEKDVAAIPPHASKVFSQFSILSNHIHDCDLFEAPKKNEYSSISYNENTSPVNFCNFICYRVGENPQEYFVTNNFFISKVSNQNYKNTIEVVDENICEAEADGYPHKVNRFISSSPDSFFSTYTTPRFQNRDKIKNISSK